MAADPSQPAGRGPEAPPLLAIDIERTGDRVLVRLTGELDIATAPSLRDVLFETLEGELIELILDLGAMEYVDSTGLSLFVSARKRALRDGVQIAFENPTPRTRRLLELTSLDGVFDIRGSTSSGG